MSAPKKNNFNMKWKTKIEREKACTSVCKHLEHGFSQESFPNADWDTVERYIENYPEDFPTEKIQAAKRQGRLIWETIGIDGALGKISGFNAASYIFNMKNRYGWRDRPENENAKLPEIDNVHIYIPDNGRDDPAHRDISEAVKTDHN